MNNSYEIDGVTITHKGGGFYELTHPKLTAPVSERGKDDADRRAKELAAELALTDDDGKMPAQDLSKIAAPLSTASTDELAQLKAQLAIAQADAEEARRAQMEALDQLKTRTVVVEGPAPDAPPARVTAAVPRRYEGVLDDKAKAEIMRLGIELTDIILEENENIPPTGLFVGHNGRGYMIVPGETVTVPNFLLEVLDRAVMSSPVIDSKTQKILGYRNRSRYPYRRV